MSINLLKRSLATLIATTAIFVTATAHGQYIVVTDYIGNAQGDVSDALQRIIDDNPNRTIFFPDGEYVISKPLLTPADPKRSVSLKLSNYAILRAAEGWSHDEAMIRLGGKHPANNITTPGSNYRFEGGIIDCRGVAKGISIDSGRETVVCDCSIKSAVVGLHIKHGANSGSSDCDIRDVNITGNNKPESVGMIIEGYDNTFTNMRIGAVHTGIILRSSANCLRNIHPLYYSSKKSNALNDTSRGFVDEAGNNFYDFCYSDEFAVGYYIAKGRHSTYSNCFAYWYSKRATQRIAFHSDGAFNATIVNLNVGLGKHNATEQNRVLLYHKPNGRGRLQNLHIRDSRLLTDHSHEAYMR